MRTLFIKLSTPGIDPTPLVLKDEIKLKKILDLASYHGTFRIVFDNLKKIGLQDIPVSIRNEMEVSLKKTHFKTMALDHELHRLLNIFDQNNIPMVLLKGPAIARYYPDDSFREYNDIDFFTQKSNLETIEKLLFKADYRHTEPELAKTHKNFMGELSFTRKSPPLLETEIHWNIINSPSLQKATNINIHELFENTHTITFQSREINVLDPEYQFLAHCAHMAYGHQYDRLVWLLDTLMIFKSIHDPDKWQVIINKSREYKIEMAVYYSFFLMQKLFGENIPETIKQALSPRRIIHRIYPLVFPPKQIMNKPSSIRKIRQSIIRQGLKYDYET